MNRDSRQGGEGADAGMRAREAGASRKRKAYGNFFLTGLGLRIYLSRQVLRGLSEARMIPPELLPAVWHAKVRKNIEKEQGHVYARE